MPKCPRCVDGYTEEWEDGRLVRDACYHCGNTGRISEEELFRDKLQNAATVIAVEITHEECRLRNENPDGEGWDFCAAECMMSGSDYFRARVWDHEACVMDEIARRPRQEQELYAAWVEAVYGP